MNEERIQQILNIEEQALNLQKAARSKADRLPLQAEQDVLAMVEQARKDAEAESRRILEESQAVDEVALIMQNSEAASRDLEAKAHGNMDRAVEFVKNQVAGLG